VLAEQEEEVDGLKDGEPVEEPVQEDNPLKEVEETVEKFDEVTKNLEEKVAEIGNLEPQKVESAAKETLNEIREMEEELRKEIEAEEAALTPKQRKGMRRWLGDFWNGVSSGWDN
jgi:molecular chaperone DnaK (HSP70)